MSTIDRPDDRLIAGPTIAFADPACTDTARTGGKGSNLGRLTHAGLAVPPGFVVPTDVYLQFVEDQGIRDELFAIVDGLDYTDAAGLATETARIRALITDQPMPEPTAQSIAAAYAGLGTDTYVAVRSTGTAEDMTGASFAGLHDTYLDIVGEEAVLDAVKRCWASMWTARATSYRHTNGFDQRSVSIAVVVQQMVSSDVSGVMFTANPLNADTTEMVVNASWGLGEAIVSGIVNPDEFVVDADRLVTTRATLGSKEKRVVRAPAPQVGVVTEDVDPAQRDVPSLTDDVLVALCRLGREVEAHYGGIPQDIEWALADGQFYLLQSRPITGADFRWEENLELAAQNPPETDDIVWTQRWAENYWTGGISPLFYSVRVRHYRKSIDAFLELTGMEHLTGVPYFKFHRGTVYWNSTFQKGFAERVVPPMFRAGAVDMMPLAWQQEAIEKPLDFFKYVRMLFAMTSSSQHSPQAWRATQRRWIDDTVEPANALSDEELSRLSDRELRNHAFQQEELQRNYCNSLWIGYNIIVPNVMGALAAMLAKWYTGSNAFIFQDLISGNPKRTLQSIETAEQFELAALLRRSPRLRSTFEEHQGAAFFAALEEFDEGREWLERYNAFVAAHAHRGAADRDIYYKRRADDPRIDYEAFVAYLKDENPTPPWEVEARVAKKREDATQEVIESLQSHVFGSVLVKAFRLLHQWTLDFLWIRDDSRHYADRISYSKRKAFLEVGRRCVERGTLAEADDCFFLSDVELYEVLDGTGRVELAGAKIAARKHDFHLVDSRQASLPLYLQGGVPVDLDGDPDAGDGGLTGLPMSKGVARGRARIVPDLAEIGRVEKGDILICNATDPGWASVFTIIEGLVLETGGMLAHGACLAREHGIPALQLRSAMKLIQDGDEVEIRGATGEIVVLTPAAA